MIFLSTETIRNVGKSKSQNLKEGQQILKKSHAYAGTADIAYDERFKAIYARLISKQGIKMKAPVAVQRKLLEMIYTVCKTDTAYDKSYLQPRRQADQPEESRVVK